MTTNSFAQLFAVIDTLTGPEGCPWDQEQTPDSMCDYLVEECFELVEAIRSQDQVEVAEELGDVLFILFFIARYFERTIPDFLNNTLMGNVAKMVRRHPHVYKDQTTDIGAELGTWEEIKKQEKTKQDKDPAVFASLPASLPPLLRAYRINSKAARLGFTWSTDQDQEQKLHEEWTELQNALATKDINAQEEEFGDYLLALVEYGRRRGLKANAALAKANTKFLQRFARLEALARERGLDLKSLSLTEMDALWDEIKATSSA